VIIEFHQEFEFPEEEITVTQYCGPDSTQWLVDPMNRNQNHPVIETLREDQWPRWIPFFNLGWTYGLLRISAIWSKLTRHGTSRAIKHSGDPVLAKHELQPSATRPYSSVASASSPMCRGTSIMAI
jgi:hypothetical protein